MYKVLVCMKGELFMASRKQQIRKQLKKKEAKDIERFTGTIRN